MLYRMKANAVGLANITILLSMTLVTLVVTIGIFLGSTQTVERAFPKEGQYTVYSQEKQVISWPKIYKKKQTKRV